MLGGLKVFWVHVGGTRMNHLQFADEQVDYLVYILLCFELVLGLKIYFNKSNTLPVVALDEDIYNFGSMLCCQKLHRRMLIYHLR